MNTIAIENAKDKAAIVAFVVASLLVSLYTFIQ